MLRRLDIHPETLVATEENPRLRPRPKYVVSARARPMTRLVDRSRHTIESHLYASRSGVATSFAADAFTTDDVLQPNISSKDTVLNLAKIAADAYIEVEDTLDWLDIGHPYNLTDDFGWLGDGLRGHIFADETNSTVIIGLKGTSPAVFDGAETTTNDKVNDNLFFSCCCARVSWWWNTVCDCYMDTAYTCDNKCLAKSLQGESLYYRASIELYHNVTRIYPDSDIWVVGHSLGGAVSSLLGQTFGLPVVTFEAPGEALASQRLNLPTPPRQSKQSADIGVYHFGHTADPIYMGTCNGPTSGCSIGGYAMETRCHTGLECTYDVVSDRGWRMGLSYHRIQSVVKDIIETYDDVPACEADLDCVDCWNWNFPSSNQSQSATSSAISVTSTSSTSACKTPGWLGCRDPISTKTAVQHITAAVRTTTSSPTIKAKPTTIICTSYGWFGNCLDPSPIPRSISTSVVMTSKQSKPALTAAETCAKHDRFGQCLDPAPTVRCHDTNFPSGCWDADTTLATRTVAALIMTSQTISNLIRANAINPGRWACDRRALWGLGWCEDWRWQAIRTGDL